MKDRTEYFKNVSTLLVGRGFAQLIPILISPILTRLYSPNEFGIFALFTAVSAICITIVTLKYELAILLPNKNEEAINIAILAITVTVSMCFVFFLLLIFVEPLLANYLEQSMHSLWLFLLPIYIFFHGLFNILNYYNSRNKNYLHIAKTNVFRSAILALSQTMLGLTKFGAYGLILGSFISSVIAYSNMLRITLSKNREHYTTDLHSLKALAIRYKKFPLYSTPSSFINISTQYLPTILIPALFSVTVLGQYYLIQRVLGTPLTLIGNSFAQVYFQRASLEKRDTGVVIKTFRYTLIYLLLISIVIFVPTYFYIEEIFVLIFGAEWVSAGIYAKILLPMFFFRFISSPMTFTFIVQEMQKELFIANIALLILTILPFLVFMLFSYDVQIFFYSLSWILSAYYLGLLIVLRLIAAQRIGSHREESAV